MTFVVACLNAFEFLDIPAADHIVWESHLAIANVNYGAEQSEQTFGVADFDGHHRSRQSFHVKRDPAGRDVFASRLLELQLCLFAEGGNPNHGRPQITVCLAGVGNDSADLVRKGFICCHV